MTRKDFRLRPTADRRRWLVCLLVCCSLVIQQFLLSPRRPAIAAGPAKHAAPARLPNKSASKFPDLDEARRRGGVIPRAVQPVPPTRQPCATEDRLCLAASDGGVRPDESTRGTIASLAGRPFLALVAVVLGGGQPALGLSVSDFYFGGGYAVSDVPVFRLPLAAVAALDAPSDLRVTGATNSNINLEWDPAPGATSYRVERSGSKAVIPQPIGTSTSPGFSNGGLTRGHSYLYRVCAADGAGACVSPYSNVAMGTAYSFADDPIVTRADDPSGATVTKVRALHVNELREAVDSVRHLATLGDATWTNPTLTPGVSRVKADDVRDLRARLGEALSVLGLAAPTYIDPIIYTPQDVGHTPTAIRRAHVAELRLAATRGKGAGPGFGLGFDFDTSRLDPVNRTGGTDAYSRNYNWSLPLVSLPGRAGLDLGLSLSYNSLVWTKDATESAVTFDADRGFPAPGFKLGFPTIQPRFINPQLQQAGQPVRYSYMLVTPSGARVELRQTDAPGTYEAADSSYLQLKDYGGTLELFSTDGTRLSFAAAAGEYLCYEVGDRNGNYISAAYAAGRLEAVTDTLGRKVTFVYDGGKLQEIRQTWKRETESNSNPPDETHVWASFGFGEPLTLGANASLFIAGLTVAGTQGGAQVSVLRRVGLSDGSYYGFDYNQWGQVWKVTRYAADAVDAQGQPNYSHALNSTWLDLPGAGASLGGAGAVAAEPQSDCPRFTKERVWVENGVMGQSGEVTTSYDAWTPNMASCEVLAPDGKVKSVETYATSGWQRGTATQSVVWALNETTGAWEAKRTSAVTLEHDGDSGAVYPTNPRVAETKVSDPQGNGRTTRVTYTAHDDFRGAESGYYDTLNVRLPKKVEECDGSSCSTASAVLRTTVTDYKVPNLGQYVSRRILGLVRNQYLYDRAESAANLRSRVEYLYDEQGDTQDTFLAALPAASPAASQHDGAYYGQAMRWRGNVNRVRRYSVDQADGTVGSYVEDRAAFNVTGTLAYAKDAAGHKTSLDYADSFFQNVNRTHTDPALKLKTYAYPTAVTDPDGFTAWTWYNYDMGVTTKARSQKPNTTTNGTDGPVATTLFDGAGRAVKTTNSVNAAHTEWVYDPSMTLVKMFTTVSDESLQDQNLRRYSATALDGVGRVRGTAHEFPGSTTATPAGNYSAQLIHYDASGRVVFQSNPTEMRIVGGVWTPAGDDANGGLWRGTTQEYDWKGRPTKTINADGSDRAVEYGGCGCAGGEVVTVRGELVPTGGTPAQARRQQKIYHDALGRVEKTEVLNWDGSVYSTVVNAYNAFDQVMSSKHYQGGTGGAFQETVRTHDGYGRLKTSKAPAQDGPVSYTYDADGVPLSVTDPRGVVTTYGFTNAAGYTNKRHLVNSVSYNITQAAGVAHAPNVAFEYDAAGNRTQMTDGLGRMDYQYSPFSRLESEARTFTDATNAEISNKQFPISYDYNLAGQLKSVTDPFGATVGYTRDQAGQLTTVTGAGFRKVLDSEGPEYTQYASDIKYRAWGAVKHMSYSNNLKLDVSYNERLQVSRYSVTPQAVVTGHELNDSQEYEYYQDGRIRFLRDLGDNRFDRLFVYDHAGRLRQGLSGGEARAGAIDAGGNTGPYSQTYQYDVWGNVKNRSTRHWTEFFSFQTSYVNNRDQTYPMLYDDAGNMIRDGDHRQHSYDAAGRKVSVSDYRGSVTHSYGGDGQRLKRVETVTDPSSTTITYHLVSSVLGGQTLTELTAQGRKKVTNVYANGALIAKQKVSDTLNMWGRYPQDAEWQHRDPVSGSTYSTNVYGGRVSHVELDPLGVETGLSNLYLPPADRDWPMMSYGEAINQGFGCTVDGVPESCSVVMRLVSRGMAAQCPRNDCGPIPVIYQGKEDWASFRVFNDGYQGYVPHHAGNIGSGYFAPMGAFARSGPPTLRRGPFDTKFAALNGATGERMLGRIPEWQMQDITGAEKQSFFNGIRSILERPNCKKFLEGVFKAFNDVSPLDPPVASSIEGVFDIINSQEGFVRVNPKMLFAPDVGYYSTVRGMTSTGNAVVQLNSIGGSRVEDLMSIIHEVFHLAGPGYNDRRMAEAVFQSRKNQQLLLTGVHQLPSDPGNRGANSSYWDRYLDQACHPGRESNQ